MTKPTITPEEVNTLIELQMAAEDCTQYYRKYAMRTHTLNFSTMVQFWAGYCQAWLLPPRLSSGFHAMNDLQEAHAQALKDNHEN